MTSSHSSTRKIGALRTALSAALEVSLQYVSTLDKRSVFPDRAALAGLDAFDEAIPECACAPVQVLEALHRHGSPATVATTGGRYFGFVSSGVLPAALAANWLCSSWDQNAGFSAMSPVASKIEEVVERWLLDILDLPRDGAAGFVTGSTMATFCALAVARSVLLKRLDYDVRRAGLRGAPQLRIVASADIHPANLRALTYLGFGLDEVESCPVDSQGRLVVESLPEADARTILLAQAGNVNSGSFDPFEEICAAARRAGAWVHVDGAFGLWARASRSKRHLTAGIEQADSWTLDAHKWLNVPMDSGIYFCRDRGAIHEAFGVEAPYLVRTPMREPNYYTPELGRRARGVEIWAALKSLGRRGIEELIDRNCAQAKRMERALAELGFDILNEVCLNQVIFRYRDDAHTQEVMRKIQQSGNAWFGPTHWRGQLALRFSECSWVTTDDDIAITLGAIREALAN